MDGMEPVADAPGGSTINSHATRLAGKFKEAMYRTPFPWIPDGTDVDAIMSAAQESKLYGIPAAKITAAYRSAYDRGLFTDLRDELSTSDFDTVVSIMK